jgi:RNA polymerase sigma factor (sigma-70 family)
MSEPEIITQCQRGNKEAQRALFESHFDRFMQISMRYAKDKNQAKEILYYAYGQLLQHLNEFQKAGTDFEDWSKEQFIAHSIAYLKSKKNEYYVTTTVRVTDKKPGDDLFNTISDEDYYYHVDAPELLKAIQCLPPSFRATYNMCMIDGFDYKKASHYLEVSEDTARFNFEKANYHLHQNIQQFQKGYK